jgi:GNAT superfamily N-acetyltransferase
MKENKHRKHMKCEKREKIINICEEYDFYKYTILRTLNEYEEQKLMDDLVCVDVWGFVILATFNDEVSVQFIFINPAYRRKGIASQYIHKLKDISGVVSFTASPKNKAMIEVGRRLGFQYVCECKSGCEDYYRFPVASMENF